MDRKNYVKPFMVVVKLQHTHILAGTPEAMDPENNPSRRTLWDEYDD